MTTPIKTILPEEIEQLNIATFKATFVGCIVLTKDNKILLQQRGHDCRAFPGRLGTFGGRIENGETPFMALTREINEELGGIVNKLDVIQLGAFTEEATNHSELIHSYFWHDKQATITGCYEDEPHYFEHANMAFPETNLMDGARWMLKVCQQKTLVK